MANTYKAFKGILQYKSTDTFTKQAGYIYFVREFIDGNATGNAEVWFGTRKYGDINTTGLAELQRQITENATGITSINDILGQWSTKFQGDISTVANAVVAVSGATVTNTSAIETLNADAETEGSVAKTVADAKSELVDGASDGYNTLGKLEDKIQAVEAAAKSYTISAVTDSGEENVLEAYALYDEDGTQAGNTIKIYKDQSLKNVELSGQTLVFTYELAAGSQKTVSVDVSAFLSESEFGDGLQVVDHVVSVKKDTSSESFLSVSADGIKLSGIQDAINTAVGNKNVEAEGDTYISATVAGNKVTVGATTDLTNVIDKANSAVQTIAEGTTNGTIKVDDTDVAVKGLGSAAYTDSSAYATAEQGEKADNAATKTDFDTHSGNTDIHITADERSAWNAKLDTAIHTAYTAATKTTLDDIESKLTAITNNAVISVASSGNTIITTNTDGAVNVDVNALAVETAQANGYIAIENNGGALYGVMYYGGEDAE